MRVEGCDMAQCERSPRDGLCWLVLALCALAPLAACGDDDASASGVISTTPPAAIAGIGGALAQPPAAGVIDAAAVSGSGAFAQAGMGAVVPPTAGAAAGAGAAGSAAGAGGMGGHTGHAMGGAAAAEMHCLVQATPDPRDDQLTGEPRVVTAGRGTDLLVPELVEDWMDEHQFAESHDGWHLVRKWDQGCRKSNAVAEGCASAQRLLAQGLTRAPIQQGAPGDGLAFMAMHRHMIQVLKATFPKHADLFSGFDKVPRTRDDPENPKSGEAISWTSDNLEGFDILENIEQNLEQFPDEDELGRYIQQTYRWTTTSPTSPVSAPGSGLHGALHAQWAVNGSPANLIQQSVDVKNHIFWKLHGWIDDVWERYRRAKGLTEDEPKYKQLLLEQCMEMHALEPRNRGKSMPDSGAAGSGAADGGALMPETGVFHTTVRPILDSSCAGCHSAMGPTAGLTLGGPGISSAEILEDMVGMKSTNGQYDLIAPGDASQSWVYLKASGEVATAACTSTCDRGAMPPSGVGLNAAQLTILRDWIDSGAIRN